MMLARRISKVAGFGISRIRRGTRLLTTSSLPSYPYLLLHMDLISPAGVVDFNFYDLVKKRRVTMEEQRIPESIHLSRNIGSSRGWMIRMNKEDLSVHLTNMFNPSLPKSSSRKVISLPPLLPLPYSLDPSESRPLTDLVLNVSLSSSPDQEDCIVAIKFWGSCISFCRRSTDDSSWSWSHIDSLPSDFKASSLIYSNTASIFYITPSSRIDSSGHHSLSFELYERKDNHGFPLVAYVLQLGPFERPGNLSDSEYKLLRKCSRAGRNNFLVETPSGDIFTIFRFMETAKEKDSDVYAVVTKWFDLYNHDMSKGAESYVGDIGDLCIFFGKNEPFCIPASMYPGLKPNSIYFTERTQVCVYDIATRNIDQLPHQEQLLTPFWLPPILHK